MYRLDNDVCLVDFRQFHQSKEDRFPTISLCLKNPFPHSRLNYYGVNQSLYLDFLRGNYFSQKMLDIDYNNVTLDISNLIVKFYVLWENNSYATYERTPAQRLAKISFNGFWYNNLYRCFSLEGPEIKGLIYFSVLLPNYIFPNNTRPYEDHNYGLFTLVHYPKQLLRSIPTRKYKWQIRATQSHYEMAFKINSVEILKTAQQGQQSLLREVDRL